MIRAFDGITILLFILSLAGRPSAAQTDTFDLEEEGRAVGAGEPCGSAWACSSAAERWTGIRQLGQGNVAIDP